MSSAQWLFCWRRRVLNILCSGILHNNTLQIITMRIFMARRSYFHVSTILFLYLYWIYMDM